MMDIPRIFIDDKTTRVDLARYFFVSGFDRTPSSIKNQDNIEGIMNLRYTIHNAIKKDKELIEVFSKFISIFNIIIYEKAREFIIDNAEGGNYDVSREDKDEEDFGKNLLESINAILKNNNTKEPNKEITISASIAGKDKQLIIKTLIIMNTH